MRRPSAGIRPLAELFALAVASWAVGLCAYGVCLAVVFWELPDTDIIAVGVWSAVVFFPLLPILYLPIVWIVQRFVPQNVRWHLAAAGVALAPLCVAVVDSFWGRIRLPSFSPENLLFGVLFATAGGVFAAWSVE